MRTPRLLTNLIALDLAAELTARTGARTDIPAAGGAVKLSYR
jgi:hypothetical protein